MLFIDTGERTRLPRIAKWVITVDVKTAHCAATKLGAVVDYSPLLRVLKFWPMFDGEHGRRYQNEHKTRTFAAPSGHRRERLKNRNPEVDRDKSKRPWFGTARTSEQGRAYRPSVVAHIRLDGWRTTQLRKQMLSPQQVQSQAYPRCPLVACLRHRCWPSLLVWRSCRSSEAADTKTTSCLSLPSEHIRRGGNDHRAARATCS